MLHAVLRLGPIFVSDPAVLMSPSARAVKADDEFVRIRLVGARLIAHEQRQPLMLRGLHANRRFSRAAAAAASTSGG